MKKLKNKDCDSVGKVNYPHVKQTHTGTEVRDVQQRLRDAKCLADKDVDGVVGPKTLSAIETWETMTRRDFFSDEAWVPVADVGGKKVMIPDVPHVSQWDYPHIEIVPGKSVQKIGCLSTCHELARAFKDHTPPDIARYVSEMRAKGGYDKSGNIQWDIACDVTGMEKFLGLSHDEAREHIGSGTPVIIEVKNNKGGQHFVLGIGYDSEGFIVHDVASWRGDAYQYPNRVAPTPDGTPGQTLVPYHAVVDIDVLI